MWYILILFFFFENPLLQQIFPKEFVKHAHLLPYGATQNKYKLHNNIDKY